MPGEHPPEQSWLVAVPSRPFNFSELYHCSHFYFLLLLVSEPKGLAAFVWAAGTLQLQGAARSRSSDTVKLRLTGFLKQE